MAELNIPCIILEELLSRESAPRVPEAAAMIDTAQVQVYVEAMSENGPGAGIMLFHAAQICEIVKPGDRVLDLASGPATQMALAAQLVPQAHFTGIDLSDQMLNTAQEVIRQRSLTNAIVQKGDITRLEQFPDHSVDVVMSTVALHHMPDVESLSMVFREVARVLKPDGGVYIADFLHLRSKNSIEAFAFEYRDQQAEVFTMDYLNSLHAAFYLHDFKAAGRPLLNSNKLYYSLFIQFLAILRSSARRKLDAPLAEELKRRKKALKPKEHKDFMILKQQFGLCGLRSPAINNL